MFSAQKRENVCLSHRTARENRFRNEITPGNFYIRTREFATDGTGVFVAEV
jgi:hypothetical protein